MQYDAMDVVLTDAKPALAAALRKTMMENVYTWAVERVSITKYSGEEPYEHVGDKLCKIAMFEESSLNDHHVDRQKCIKIHVSFRSPFTTELHPLETGNFVSHSVLKVADPHAVITTLRMGQVLEAELEVTYRCGAFHDKWSPAVAISTHLAPIITLDKSLVSSSVESFDEQEGRATTGRGKKKQKPSRIAKSLMTSCPTGVFQWNDEIEDLEINVAQCTLCRQCENDFGSSLNLSVTQDHNNPSIHVETNGTMSPQALLHHSALALKQACMSL